MDRHKVHKKSILCTTYGHNCPRFLLDKASIVMNKFPYDVIQKGIK